MATFATPKMLSIVVLATYMMLLVATLATSKMFLEATLPTSNTLLLFTSKALLLATLAAKIPYYWLKNYFSPYI